jgi:phospholipid/cholesterol/gamma-HCH transport system substrate-binding protein
MEESMNKRGIGVGFFIVIGLLLFVGGVMTIGNLHSTFQKKMTISTVFGDINGLQTGNNILFSGVKIGTIKRTEFYGKNQVKVIMNINIESKQYIRKNAMAKISTDGLIGNKILIIYGGSELAPEVEQDDTLANETALSTEEIMLTFQQNNLNVLALTKKLANGEGTMGKLISNDSIYYAIAATMNSLKIASANAQEIINSMANFTSKLNKEGTLVNELVSDTILYKSLKNSALKINKVADTAAIFIRNLKIASQNPNSPVGVMLHDEKVGAELKNIIVNLESSSKKLDTNLEAIQHSFLLRRYFEKKLKKD